MPQPYKVFTIYAREDAQYLSELLGQLRPLEIANRIEVWSDREINPGVEWEKEIVAKLDTADIILILVSSAYYNSVYIHEVEIKYALSRHERGEARVLPLIVRPCSFLDDPTISKLQVLPTDGKPVTDRRYWQERDHAWLDVVAGVKRTLDSLHQVELMRIEAALSAERQQQQEALDEEEKVEHERIALERQIKDQASAEKENLSAEQSASEEALDIEKEQSEKEIDQPTQLEVRQTELGAWQKAADVNSYDSYKAYLKQFPKGDFALAAQYRLKGLRKGGKENNPGLVNRIVILSGIGWGVVEMIALLVLFIDEVNHYYQDGIGIINGYYDVINHGAGTMLIAFLPITIFAMFTTRYILKRCSSNLFSTIKEYIYFGVKTMGIVGVTAVVLIRIESYPFYGSQGFILVFEYVIFGAIIGLFYGLIALRKKQPSQNA